MSPMQPQRERSSLIALGSNGSEDRNMSKWPTQHSIRRMASAMMSSSMLLRLADSKEMTNSNKGDSKKQQQQQQQRSRRPRSRQSSRPRVTAATAPPLEPPKSSYSFPDSKGQSNLRRSNSNSSKLKSMDKWIDDHYPEEPLPSSESSGSIRLARTEMSDPQQQKQQRQPSNESSRRNVPVRKEMRASEPRSKRKTRKITLEPEEHQQQKVQAQWPFLQQKASQQQQQQQQQPIPAPTINLIRGVINDDDENVFASDTESFYTMERTIEDGDADTVTLDTAATMESSFTLMEMKRSTCKMLHDEILGVMDDTCRSVEQVFTAFTLQEADVKAVCTRIDRAKVQMHQSLKITTIHEDRRKRAARRLEL